VRPAASPGGATRPVAGARGCLPRSTAGWRCGRPGVTYERSRTARMAEERAVGGHLRPGVRGGGGPSCFFKSAALAGSAARASRSPCGPIRPSTFPSPSWPSRSTAAGAIAGYTICNDMSSRSIEGENPLYLPQAKIYLGGCAVGPVGSSRPWEVRGPVRVDHRAEDRPWRLHRLGRQREPPRRCNRKIDEAGPPTSSARTSSRTGVILSTGTSLVPDLPFTLEPGDEVRHRDLRHRRGSPTRSLRGKAAASAVRLSQDGGSPAASSAWARVAATAARPPMNRSTPNS